MPEYVVHRKDLCETCNGTGFVTPPYSRNPNQTQRCKDCEGKGYIYTEVEFSEVLNQTQAPA